MKTSDQGKRQIRGHTLPPLENNSRNKNNEVRSSLFYTFVVLLFLLPILFECTVLPNTEILPLCVCTLLNKKTCHHGTILNQPRQGTAECRVSSIHHQTEGKKSRAGNRNTKQGLSEGAP